ncbi:MAG: hypothetical protein J6I87_06465 [Rikenellaceae bacterium]|nr:hypothetical protein [Rikenellaceae bacterium]
MNRLQNILLAAMLFLAVSATAQSERPEVRATLTPDSVLLGDEVLLTIDVRKDQVQVIGFPTFDTGENGELELIEELPLDTIERDGRRQHLRKRYRLAAYGEGTLALGRTPLLYLDKNINDTIYSADSLVLYIEPIEIDTTTMTINDVKRPREMPLRWGEISGYLWRGAVVVLLLVALVALIIWLIHKYNVKMPNPFRPKEVVPPHVVAIKALEALHHQKLWQNNRHKDYYSALTDILRRYLADRYEFGAMEMTSDEIVAALREQELPDKSRRNLIEILRTADLVKFAKAVPDEQYNEQAYLDAYYFVEETKAVEVIEAESDETRKEIDY